MRKLFFYLSFFFFSQMIFSQNSGDISMMRQSKISSIPSYIQFSEDSKIQLSTAFEWIKTNYKISEHVSFDLISSFIDDLGIKHDKYQEFYNGKRIKDAVWIIHSKNNLVVSMNGLLFSDIRSLDFNLDENDALQKALDFVGADSYKWQIPGEEEHLKKITKNPKASHYPTAEYVYYKSNDGGEEFFIPTYQFTIYAYSEVYKANIFINAVTGEIVNEERLIHDADVIGSASTVYSGVKPITTDSYAGGFRLRESGRGNGINTFNMQQGVDYFNAVDFVDNDNNWNNTNVNLDQYATDVHYGSEMTYDYFLLEHNRNSIDNAGFEINSYVHYDVQFANAFWDGYQMTYGDGDGTISPLTSLDVVGHEITHGLTSYSANLNYQNESGALNESFSDIFGTTIERYARPGNWDWNIGGDLGSQFRSMSNPNVNNNPDTYLGDFWDPNEEVHTNSGVQNHWFYLLTEGGSGTNDNGDNYVVNGIGMDKAGDIAFRNLTVYLTPDSDYSEARFYAIISAADLYGGCTPEVEATTNAWYAVGVGDIYVPVTEADFTADLVSSCEVPFTVNFQNLSSNGVSYTWNFGDGQTSNFVSPSHTYTSFGDYTVTLDVVGGACGNDTYVATNYITVDPSLPCNYEMPFGGSLSSSSCTGTLTDSGGSFDNYTDQESSIFVIQPSGAQTITINFGQFNIEEELNCDYDYLSIYDGANTSSPLIGKFCNGSPPPSTITSTGGAITIRFYSDEYLNLSGFSLTWNCNIMPQAPSADFTVNQVLTCDGNVSFYDQSLFNPTSWLWNFGDGQTSTMQNPTHTYAAVGVYNVELQVTNSLGTDTKIKNNYIHFDNCASLEEVSQNEFYVYPNPAIDRLFFTTVNNESILIEITDIMGRSVLKEEVSHNTTSISIEAIESNGTYFIIAKDHSGRTIGKNKFIKLN